MRALLSRLGLCVLVACPPLGSSGFAAETLQVAGTGGATAMVERVAAGFEAETGIKIVVVPGLGSKGGIRAAADGVVDLAVAARPLDSSETAYGLTAAPMARTALVFVTSHLKPNSLKSSDLTGIFKAISPKWADGSPINLILRTKLDGDSILLEKQFSGMAEAVAVARLRPEFPIAPPTRTTLLSLSACRALWCRPASARF